MNNSPINFADPSGHMPADEECGVMYCKQTSSEVDPPYQPLTSVLPSSTVPSNPPNNNNPFITSDSCNSGPCYKNPEQQLEDSTFLQWLRVIKFLTTNKDWILLIANYGEPAYKQLKGLGSASAPLEGILGMEFQAAVDASYRPDLQMDQRIFRATTVGVENAITDVASEFVGYIWGVPTGAAIGGGATSATGPGMAGGLTGGALVGKVYVSYVINGILDNTWKNTVNPLLFNSNMNIFGGYP
jgi:hypothetical protein